MVGGGGGVGGGVGREGLILSVLSGIISPARVRTLCAEVIVALMATPIAVIAPGLALGEKCGDTVALGELRRRLLSA